MENIPNQQNQNTEGCGSAEQTAGPQSNSQTDSKRCVLDTLYSAIRNGAKDAKNVAEKAIPSIKSAAVDAGYWVSYGISFAAVFQWTVAKKLTPECVKSGFHDGVKAGRESAEQWVERRKRQSEHAPATSPPLLGPSAQETQPSAS